VFHENLELIIIKKKFVCNQQAELLKHSVNIM